MNILYFTQFFTPEPIAGAFRAAENASLWTKSGHNVTVFTGFPNYPKGKIFDGYKPTMLKEENMGGVRVLRSKLVAVPNTTIVNRLKNALSYYGFGRINEILRSRKIGKDYDVVIGSSGPIFNAILAYKYAKRHKIPFVFELRDLTYAQMIATGKQNESKSVILMKTLEIGLCNRADKVVVVTEGFKKLLRADGIPNEKIDVITNGVDVAAVKGVYGNEKKFVLSYFGTMGISQDIPETFSYAKEISKHIPNMEYLIIGDGAQSKEVKAQAENNPAYSFIRIHPGMPSSELENYYASTQLSIVKLRKDSNFKNTIPSKIFQIMGRGIAVMFIGPKGEASNIVSTYNAGIVLTGTIEEDMEKLHDFFSRQDWLLQLQKMGENGRKATLENYSRAKLADKYLELLTDAAGIPEKE